MLKRILNLNSVWAVFFTVTQVGKFYYLTNDGHPTIPLSLVQYKEMGGSAFNYYAGYLFFATYTDWLHYLFVLLYFAVWMYGYACLTHIDSYRDQQKTTRAIPLKNILSKPFWVHYVFSALTTMITVYGILYTVVYIAYYWLK